ncbi:PIN domain-like protein [Panaeolus papilionaceus]|nr:PIN domain-like protein [Panaeolus papilionaceus]
MGISGLLPALQAITKKKHLSELRGKRVAVDAYGWLHKGVYGCATELALGKPTTKYVDFAMKRVQLLRHHGIEPYLVFDGGPLPAKEGTEGDRKKRREEQIARGRAFTNQGKHSQARECFVKSIDVTPEMAYQLIKALQANSVQYVVAPYEADAQLAYLEKQGLVDAILTEDSDLLVFGCHNVWFKLSTDAFVETISRRDFNSVTATAANSASISLVGWNDSQFRAMAILSGCDYLPSIPGVGLKTAATLLKKWKTAEMVIRHLNMEGKKSVPIGYLNKFQLAEKCFLHQRVYCPIQERLVHLTPVDENEWNAEFDTYVGRYVTSYSNLVFALNASL